MTLYDVKPFGIYRNNEEFWHQVLLKTNFPTMFGTAQQSSSYLRCVFAFCSICTYCPSYRQLAISGSGPDRLRSH